MTVRWLAESRRDGELHARVGRDGDRLVAEWPDLVRFSVRRDGSDPVFESHPDADRGQVDKLRRGAVRLLLAHLAGGISLHASAVALEGRAVVFVGGSGQGKSTLAAALCELLGATLLGDDAVTIEVRREGYDVVALEGKHWLDAAAARAIGREGEVPDDETDKAPLDAPRVDLARAPLALVVHVAFADDDTSAVRLERVLGLEAVSGLLAQLTRFVVDEPEIARRDLTALAGLVERVPILRLVRPRRLDLLRASAERIAGALHGEFP